MFKDNDIIWLVTYNGLSKFKIKNGDFTNYVNVPEDDQSLSNNVVVGIEKDRENNFWVGTLKRLQIFDEKKSKI